MISLFLIEYLTLQSKGYHLIFFFFVINYFKHKLMRLYQVDFRYFENIFFSISQKLYRTSQNKLRYLNGEK